jgi:Kef-type K+ transport system membrane component KefB
VLAKLVKRESLQDYEKRLPARRYAHRPLTAFSIPAAVMTMGLFYIFGSLEHLHGAQPSERTFLGVIPIMTSTNVTMRMILSSRLKAA